MIDLFRAFGLRVFAAAVVVMFVVTVAACVTEGPS